MISNNRLRVEVYTDGSCHTQLCIGAWAAVLFIDTKKIVLSGTEMNTTHNRMELVAVITAIEYVKEEQGSQTEINIYSDSQYVIGLTRRKEKLVSLNYETRKGNEIRNVDLVKMLLEFVGSMNLQFIKVKAHQKLNGIANYNIEIDKLSRKIVRESVNLKRPS